MTFEEEVKKRGLFVHKDPGFSGQYGQRFSLSIIDGYARPVDIAMSNAKQAGLDLDLVTYNTGKIGFELVPVYRRVFHGTLDQAWDFLKDFQGSGVES